MFLRCIRDDLQISATEFNKAFYPVTEITGYTGEGGNPKIIWQKLDIIIKLKEF